MTVVYCPYNNCFWWKEEFGGTCQKEEIWLQSPTKCADYKGKKEESDES